MTQHPAIQPGNVAVITGGASGIGLATAKKLAAAEMRLVIVDHDLTNREAVLETLIATTAALDVRTNWLLIEGDVADVATFKKAREAAALFGPVTFLMNNAGVGRGGHAFERPDRWRAVLETNLFGVLNGVQAFTQSMIDHGKPAAIVNTGSKQGITCPPGDTAYNVSKAGIKVLTEGLQHTLRNTPGCQVWAHLLVPGSTFTGMTARSGAPKPPGAWSADEVADFMLDRLAAGDFYILCPDNDVTREIDNARMDWAMDDLILNRPPLSRWHPDYKDAFAAFLAERTGG